MKRQTQRNLAQDPKDIYNKSLMPNFNFARPVRVNLHRNVAGRCEGVDGGMEGAAGNRGFAKTSQG